MRGETVAPKIQAQAPHAYLRKDALRAMPMANKCIPSLGAYNGSPGVSIRLQPDSAKPSNTQSGSPNRLPNLMAP